jgi:hypothetical protein
LNPYLAIGFRIRKIADTVFAGELESWGYFGVGWVVYAWLSVRLSPGLDKKISK